jgi:fluoride exporter
VPEEAEPNHYRGGLAAAKPADPRLSSTHVPDRDEYRDVIDPDVDRHDLAQRRETRPRQWDLILATSVGGVLGAEARYYLGLAVAHHGAQFPWSTVLINATGCFAIGIVMVILLELTSPHRLLRPFLGVGVLGGYTTFSSYTVDVQRLVAAGAARTALLYLIGTALAALAAVHLGVILTRRATGTIGRRKERP